MNASNAKAYLPFVQALAEGKTIQWSPGSYAEWKDTPELYFGNDPSRYRIKPEPKLAPWSCATDVPFPALFRWKDHVECPLHMLIAARWDDGFSAAYATGVQPVSFEVAFGDGEVSLDGGKTWSPCGKVVTQ